MSAIFPMVADVAANNLIGNEQPVNYFGSDYASQELGRPVGIGRPGVGMGVGMDYRNLINPVAEQTQQQIANPIYGQQSPFQPPMPQPAPQPIQDVPMVSGGGKSIPGPGQLVGGPVDQPILGTPSQPPLQGTPMQGMPMQGAPGSNYRQAPGQRPGVMIGSPGGLKPAPRNYRPPRRGGNLRSFIGR